jgi:hypothetical protein
VGQPTGVIVVDRDMANINFNTGFIVNLTGVLSQPLSQFPAIEPFIRIH